MTPTGRGDVCLPKTSAEGANGEASRLPGDCCLDHGIVMLSVLAYFIDGSTEWVLPIFTLGLFTGIAEWVMRLPPLSLHFR
jgi:hypothetical protein